MFYGICGILLVDSLSCLIEVNGSGQIVDIFDVASVKLNELGSEIYCVSLKLEIVLLLKSGLIVGLNRESLSLLLCVADNSRSLLPCLLNACVGHFLGCEQSISYGFLVGSVLLKTGSESVNFMYKISLFFFQLFKGSDDLVNKRVNVLGSVAAAESRFSEADILYFINSKHFNNSLSVMNN